MGVRFLALAWTALACACAQGAGDPPGGGGRDGGNVGRLDGSGRRDGSGLTCMDEGNGESCAMATALGTIMPGGSAMSMRSVLNAAGDEDWFSVQFPPTNMPNMAGGGSAMIDFAQNDMNAFRFEVRGTCVAALGCTGGMAARDLLMWSFTDDQSMPGEGAYLTRMIPWPADLRIRVYRMGGAPDCSSYQLRVSR
jgi:hypothetical protein